MAANTRPNSLNAVHNYNLRNQGWPYRFICTLRQDGKTITSADPVRHTYGMMGFYPSNADVLYYAKTTVAQEPEGVGAYSPWWLEKYVFGNTPAARGHYILSAFDRNRQLASGISGIYNEKRDKEDSRPISTAFYAGRVWYLMPDGRLYFSQILTDIANANKCYQDADPTAEDINELVATDGGEIDIVDIGKGLKLVQISNFLVVFADNGIWSISGDGDGKAFTATSQEIQKITEIGAIGPDSMVEAEGTIYYWSDGGIYTIQSDQVTAELGAVNLTENIIQELYIDIREVSKRNVRSYYDEQTKKIFWMYNDLPDYDGESMRYKYNRVLILDLVLQAFYTYTFNTSSTLPFVSAIIKKQPGSIAEVTANLTDSTGALVTTTTSAAITSKREIPSVSEVKIKFLCFNKGTDGLYRYSFAELVSNEMMDWKSVDGTGLNYLSYAETGHDVMEDLISEKEANTIYFFFKRTEKEFIADGNSVILGNPSSCLFQAKWDWTNTNSSGRWTDPEQIYRFRREYFPIPVGPSTFDYGFDVVQVIQQVRGKGRALSLRFESEQGKDFHLLGWAIPYTGLTAA